MGNHANNVVIGLTMHTITFDNIQDAWTYYYSMSNNPMVVLITPPTWQETNVIVKVKIIHEA